MYDSLIGDGEIDESGKLFQWKPRNFYVCILSVIPVTMTEAIKLDLNYA